MQKEIKPQTIKRIADLTFEIGSMSYIQRSGFAHLGDGKQSIAEHSFEVACLGFLLAQMTQGANPERVTLMCLFHDLEETRLSDLVPVHQQYVLDDSRAAIEDAWRDIPGGEQIKALLFEKKAKETLEAKLARDADSLDHIFKLIQLKHQGNRRAGYWLDIALPRLTTEAGKKLAATLIQADPDDWWKGPCGLLQEHKEEVGETPCVV